MNSKRFLIKLQFLGFRYHGVQKQTNHHSIQERIEKTLIDSLKTSELSTRFASRTDAMVSALETYFLLMCEVPQELGKIKEALSKLPPDIMVLNTEAVADDFTILKNIKEKEYHYFFSHNASHAHVFSAPYMTILKEELDLEIMKKGAELFNGTHNFINYCHKPKEGMNCERTILKSEIVENDFFTASFFPKESFVFKVSGEGFMRGQVRLMMGSLFRLGKKEISLSDFQKSLEKENSKHVKWMVPSSGLILHKTALK